MKLKITCVLAVLLMAAIAFASQCLKCGRGNEIQAKFCSECGAKLIEQQSIDFSGKWRMIENGNEVTLIILQNGDRITGEFIDERNSKRDRITGVVTTSIAQWNIQKIEFTRAGEINDYEGYMMTHGREGGRYQYRAMAGSFLRRDLGGRAGWYATRAE